MNIKKHEINISIDEKIFDNYLVNVGNNFKKIYNILEQYGYCIIFFENNVFIEYNDENIKVQVISKNNIYITNIKRQKKG